MGRRRIALFDLDGVLCNSQPCMHAIVRSRLGYVLPMTQWSRWNTIFQYAVEESGETEVEVAQWMFADHVMFAPPCPGAAALVEDLTLANCHVAIATSRWQIKRALTLEWIEVYLPQIKPGNVFLRPKGENELAFKAGVIKMLKPMCYIDDRGRTIRAFSSNPYLNSVGLGVVDRPWNRWLAVDEVSRIKRFGNWPDDYGLLAVRDWILRDLI